MAHLVLSLGNHFTTFWAHYCTAKTSAYHELGLDQRLLKT